MSNLRALAIAFHAGAEQMRTMEAPKLYGPDGAELPENPMAVIARSISADILQTIGNIYLGLAVNEDETSNTSKMVQ